MFKNISDTPFKLSFSESEPNTMQTESDCPFGGAAFSLSDLSPIPEDICEPEYLKPAETEEESQSDFQVTNKPEYDYDSLLGVEFRVENDNIVHTPSGSVINNAEIEVLLLSPRSYNALRRNGIERIVQLANIKMSILKSLKNLGKSSIEEIVSKLNQFLKGEIEKECAPNNLANQENCGMSESAEKVEVVIEDDLVENYRLSVRAKNCLMRNGILHISQLLELSSDDLMSFTNLGKKTLNEILAIQAELRDKVLMMNAPDESSFPPEILGFLDEFMEEIHVFNMSNKHIRSLLLSELDETCSDVKTCFDNWWREIHVQEALGNYIINCVKEKYMFGISAAEIMKRLPSSVDLEMLFDILYDLTENNLIVLRDNDEMYYPVTVSVMEVFEGKSIERIADVLDKRMRQYTFEEIAEDYGLTRERVRQLQLKAIRILNHECKIKGLMLTEERYRTLFETYQLTKEEFIALTGEDERAYGYLNLVSKCGDTLPEMIVYDENIPRWMRSNWIRYVRYSASARYIYLPEENHRRIKKTRTDIENYILSKYCQDEVVYEKFIELYNEFVRCHQLENLLLTEEEMRTRENALSKSLFVLWKHGRRLRYYNIPSKDYIELLQALDLMQYHNTEISTLKLLRDNPELMKQYDIRDEYELHNLLKKIGAESENPSLRFERTPGIKFGEFDREQMIKERLFELAPIKTEDLAAAISEECGFNTVHITSWFKCIHEYQQDGVYTVDFVPMSDEHMALLKSHLTKDMYFFSEVKEIYQELVPNADTSLISSFNLKRMGFVVNANYIIQHYDSAAKMFEHLLTQADVQDISPLSKKYGYIMSYASKLAELKDDYEIIEFSPYQYINIRKLKKMGIEKENLREYCNAVDMFVDPDTYFTVEYLQKQGFSSQLDALGFEAWFYSSLLREDARFSYIKLGGTVLFYKGRKLITEQTLLHYLLQQYSSIELDELIDDVYDAYHITLDKDNVKWNIKDTEMYYDDIMCKIYRNYDVYLEELEEIEENDWMEDEYI
ncbi:MAG: DNA-directed RNA polymerase subunit alpha C-terminal domain-containing protein [Ruminococcus sp.]